MTSSITTDFINIDLDALADRVAARVLAALAGSSTTVPAAPTVDPAERVLATVRGVLGDAAVTPAVIAAANDTDEDGIARGMATALGEYDLDAWADLINAVLQRYGTPELEAAQAAHLAVAQHHAALRNGGAKRAEVKPADIKAADAAASRALGKVLRLEAAVLAARGLESL